MTNRNNPAWSPRQLAVIERLWPLPVHQDTILAEINAIRVGEVRRTHSALETVARRLKVPRNAEWLQARKVESARKASNARWGNLKPTQTGGWPDGQYFADDPTIAAADGARLRLSRPATHVPSASSAHTMAGV